MQAGPGGDHDYRIFSASIDNTVRLWDPYDMACIRVMEEMYSEISAMTFYEGWNLLVTGALPYSGGGRWCAENGPGALAIVRSHPVRCQPGLAGAAGAQTLTQTTAHRRSLDVLLQATTMATSGCGTWTPAPP